MLQKNLRLLFMSRTRISCPPVRMDRRRKLRTTTSPLGRLTLIISFCSVVSWGDSCVKTNKENPFTPKASLIRYWNTHIANTLSIPSFLLSKSSPLSAVDSAFFAELTARKALHSHLPSFCSSAKLLCPSILHSDPTDDDDDATFAVYSNKRFSNYGSSSLDGVDTFKNYSDGNNFATSSFSRYSRSSTAHQEDFNSYANHANVANSNFSSYAASSTGGSAHFNNYLPLVNLPNLRFSSYDSDTNGHEHTFSSYADNTNSGNQAFLKYAKKGNDSPMNFTSYGGMSNVLSSTFTSYSELGNSAIDSFSSYGSDSNNPRNNFKGYSVGVNDGMVSFTSYRDGANAGTDTFHSYGKRSNSENMNFVNYGKSLNEGADTFTGYGKESAGQLTGFQVYGLNSTFKDYAPTGVTFSEYTSPDNKIDHLASMVKGICGNKCGFSGKFFREYMLREGMVMKMPDIRDRKPERSFLPRSILSKLPISSKDLSELKRIFGVVDNSSMEHMLVDALVECERDPSPGETKRCVGSIEDMIDFAISILGDNVVVRTTENVDGSNEIVMLGKVEGINSGEVTKSVSCHQSLYPYLLYYCHFVPKVRVYLVDILGVNTKAKINHGVAICHVDTSSWSPGHGAFVALGSSPGDIEVCHWIYENDMTWAMAD